MKKSFKKIENKLKTSHPNSVSNNNFDEILKYWTPQCTVSQTVQFYFALICFSCFQKGFAHLRSFERLLDLLRGWTRQLMQSNLLPTKKYFQWDINGYWITIYNVGEQFGRCDITLLLFPAHDWAYFPRLKLILDR